MEAGISSTTDSFEDRARTEVPGVVAPCPAATDHSLATDLIARLAAAGRLRLDAPTCAQAPAGIAALLERWQALGLPVRQDADQLVWQPAPGQALSVAAIGAALAAAGRPCPVCVEVLTDSSNARALADAAAGASAPRVVLAEVQSAGRGRRQRSWQAGYGEAILMSVLLRPRRAPAQWPGLALAAGVALARTLAEAGVSGIGLKWPNDLVLSSGKLAGLLVEAASGSAGTGAVVVGLGVNWRLGSGTRARIEQPAADLADAPVPAWGDRSALAGRLAASLLAMAEHFDAEGLAPFLPGFERFDSLRGRPIQVLGVDGRRPGVALGIAADGALRVDHGGRIGTYHSADVTIDPA